MDDYDDDDDDDGGYLNFNNDDDGTDHEDEFRSMSDIDAQFEYDAAHTADDSDD